MQATPLILGHPGYLTSREAAEVLGVSVAYMKRLVQLGKLQPYVIRGSEARLFRQEDIHNYKRLHPAVGQRRAITRQVA